MFRYWIALSLFAATGLARAESLSLETALDLAVRASPDIATETASVQAAQASAVAAGTLPDPKLTFGVQNVPTNGPDQWSLTRDFMTMKTIGLMQDLPNRGKRRAQADEAAAMTSRTEAERRVRIRAVRRDAAVAWLNRYYVERRRALFDDLDRENHLFEEAVQAQLAGGRGVPADSIVPKQEAAELADRRDELAVEWAQANAALKRWVGEAAQEPLASDAPALAIDSEGLRTHVHEHPELAVFVPMTQFAQAEVHEAEADKHPDWSVELNYGRRGPLFSDMVSLQFSIGLPLFTRTRQDPRITAKRQELARVEGERETMLRDHTEELERELAQYETLGKQLTRMREVRVPLARQKVDLQFASYGAGKADLTTVLQARRELIDQQIRQIELEGQRTAIAAKLYFVYAEGAQ